MTINYISESKLRILEALAVFKYLSTSQFIKLGIKKYASQLYPLYKELIQKKKPYISKVSFGVDPQQGRLEDIYFLTQNGVDFLVEQLEKNIENIKYPKNNNSLFARYYQHRKYCVDFHIQLRLEARKVGFLIPFFHYYFDKVGSTKGKIPLRAKTQITVDETSYLVADSIFMIEKENVNHMYVMEQHNGKDTKRLINDLEKHIYALDKDAKVNEVPNFEKAYRILCILESTGVKKAIMPKLRSNKNFDYFHEYIYFKTMDDLNSSRFLEDWHTIDNRMKALF